MNVNHYDFSKNLSETELLDELDFHSSFKASVECPAGGGKSFYLLDYLKRKNIPFIFATDTLLLGRRLATRHALPFYCAEDRSCYEAEQLITVYQHIPKFIHRDTTLILDEAHSLITDYGWKKEVIEQVLTTGFGYKRVILLSGTPLYSRDSFYEGLTIFRAARKEVQTRKLITVKYVELTGGIVELTMGLRESGKTVVISLLDKSDTLPLLEKSLRDKGIVKLAVINSMTKKQKKEPDETDIEVAGNTGYYDQLLETGELDAEVIITTYRQGYDLKGKDYELIIAPGKNKHSYTDIVQMMNRFRDIPDMKACLLANDGCGEDHPFNLQEINNTLIDNYTRETVKLVEKMRTSDYRTLKFSQWFETSAYQKFIYPEYYINHHLISYTAYQEINKALYGNLFNLRHVLSEYGIVLYASGGKTSLKITNNLTKEKSSMKYTKEDIKIAIEQFYTYFLNPQALRFEAFNTPVRNTLHWKIQEYHEKFKSLDLPDEQIRELLETNMGNTERMNRTLNIYMIKYSPDVTMRLYRKLLLENFEIGMKIRGEEIVQKTNSLRHEVGLPDQKHNTAVEYFNLLFETKRIRFSDTREQGYQIISAF
ncbi:MAG: hypothetical protein ACLTSL_09535 [Odoribacter splanchnicus]